MYVNKKKNLVPALIVIILGLAIIIGIIAYSIYVSANVTSPFVPERQRAAERLYEETLARDLAAYYPQSPEELMNLYAAAMFFLYGNFIADEDFMLDVLDWQRQMLHPYLLEINPPQYQFANLVAAIEALNESGISPRRAEITATRFDFANHRRAEVHLRQVMVHYEKMYWVYFLETDEDDKWRILGWVRTDNTFQNEIE